VFLYDPKLNELFIDRQHIKCFSIFFSLSLLSLQKKYMENKWFELLNIALTVMDNDGKIVYMNEKASKTFLKYGGKELIGKSLYDCHSLNSIEIIQKLLKNKETNAYTIEKNGVKKLIYQTPWYEGEECKGLVELSLEIPFEMPHFVRG